MSTAWATDTTNNESTSNSEQKQQQQQQQDEEEKVAEGYIRLVSGDGFSFTVAREYACVSSVIEVMLNSGFKESRTRIIKLPHVTGKVLEKVCQYFYYIPRFQMQNNSQHHQTEDIKIETFPIPSDISIDVLLCAKYLDL